MGDALDVDGSQGEGGGQILRTSLSLSLVTGRPFRIRNVRAGRAKPGLLRQHLAAVRAAAAIGVAHVEGDALGSTELAFAPTTIQGGRHRFAVGGAGSSTLVFQTVLPALLAAKEPTELSVEGGTHNPWAPPYDFLERAFLPLLRRMGGSVELTLERRGFHPAGGGLFTARVEPSTLRPLVLETRGEIRRRAARVILANLASHVLDRELKTLRKLLPGELWTFESEIEADKRGPGNVVVLDVEGEHATEVFTGFGRVEARAEAVAHEAVDEMREWLAADVPVGPHLADQLLIPLALAGGGSFRTVAPTGHTRTNRDVIALFLPQAAPRIVDDGGGARVAL